MRSEQEIEELLQILAQPNHSPLICQFISAGLIWCLGGEFKGSAAYIEKREREQWLLRYVIDLHRSY